MLTGWLSLIFFAIATLYVFLTARKLIIHCIISYVAIAICIIHTVITYSSFGFSTGYILLISIVLITVSGILMKHFPKQLKKRYSVFKMFHIIISAVSIIALIIHILEYLILL